MAREVLTAQQERFAQLVVIYGKKQRIAYRKAFPLAQGSDNSIDVRASELMRHTKVAARIEELRKMAEAKLEATVEQIGQQMARMAYFDIRDCYDDDGKPLLPHELPEHVAISISGYEVVPGKLGQKVKVTHDRSKGVEMMARWRKMFVEQVEHGNPGDFSNLTDEELADKRKASKEAVALIERARKAPKVKVLKLTQA